MMDRSMWPKWWQYCTNCGQLGIVHETDIPGEVQIECESCEIVIFYDEEDIAR